MCFLILAQFEVVVHCDYHWLDGAALSLPVSNLFNCLCRAMPYTLQCPTKRKFNQHGLVVLQRIALRYPEFVAMRVGEVVRFRTFPSKTSRRLMATMALAMDMPRALMKMEGGAVGHIDIPHDSPEDVFDADWSNVE